MGSQEVADWKSAEYEHVGIETSYDTIHLCALKNWRYGQLSLAHGTKTKNKEKLKTKTD